MEIKILQQLGMRNPFRSHRTVRASRTCKSGMNNAAREIEHPILGAAESLPLLNEEFAKSSFCGGKDSSAPTSNSKLSTSNFKLSPSPCQPTGKGPKSGLNNAARKTNIHFYDGAERIPLPQLYV